MYYPEDIVEEVRSKNDIVDIISGYVRLTKKGSTYFGLCPFHNEKTGSFSVSPGKQMFYCFGCGAGGNVYTFLMKYENATFKEAIEKLADRAGVKLPEYEMTQEQKQQMSEKQRLLDINKEAATYFFKQLRSQNGKNAMAYFEGRRLSPETMHKFGLGYSLPYSDDLTKYLRSKGYSDELIVKAGLGSHDEKRGTHDKFWNRVMFPIQDANHRVIGFGGRVMGEGEPKYLNSPETPVFAKSRNLYGLNFAAVFNCSINAGSMFISVAYGAGTKAALRAIGILRDVGLNAKILHLEPYKDPDEFIKNEGNEEFQKRIDNAQNSFFFEIDVLERNYNLSDPQEKTAFHREIAKKICEFEDEVERDNYTDAICKRYNISVDAMKKLIIGYAGLGITRKEPVAIKSGVKKLNPDEGRRKAQRLLITWLSEEPQLLDTVTKFISPRDFTGDIYRTVAEKLFEGIASDKAYEPASMVSMFDDEEEQKEVALLFNTKLVGLDGTEMEMESIADRERAFKDIMVKVKEASLDEYSRQLASDVTAITDMIAAKKKLEELKQTVIHI